MVQEVVGRRARNRLERHGAFLATAKRIVAAEGLEALTMQRLAAEVDCAVGTAYTYFPSKSALVAQVQADAIERLTASYLLFRARLAGQALDGVTAPVAGLAEIVGFARFWVATFDTFPEEAKLLQLLMSEPPRPVIADEDVGRVVPSALRLLGLAAEALGRAVELGALREGDALDRAVRLAAATNGVLLLDQLGRVDAELFRGARHAAALVAELLAAWGATPGDLAAAEARVESLARLGPLAQEVVWCCPLPSCSSPAGSPGPSVSTSCTASPCTSCAVGASPAASTSTTTPGSWRRCAPSCSGGPASSSSAPCGGSWRPRSASGGSPATASTTRITGWRTGEARGTGTSAGCVATTSTTTSVTRWPTTA
jgi:AcrR family transcriptional regulator